MKRQLLLCCILVLFPLLQNAQFYRQQYFDGADTIPGTSIFIDWDSSGSNIWQVGIPQKNVFTEARSLPKAIMTDTLNPYPVNNESTFGFTIDSMFSNFGVLAVQWSQKLDMDTGKDGGIVEFSVDTGKTWQNAFNNPYVYNFYGYSNANIDTLPDSTVIFSGIDTTWRDLWLCFDMSWLSSFNVHFMVRYTFMSDSIFDNKDGWMVDNILVHPTYVHTISEVEQPEYIKVAPNPTSGKLDIIGQKLEYFHIIEKIELYNTNGHLVQQWGKSPTKFSIDIGRHKPGVYYLKVFTNVKAETLRVVLKP